MRFGFEAMLGPKCLLCPSTPPAVLCASTDHFSGRYIANLDQRWDCCSRFEGVDRPRSRVRG